MSARILCVDDEPNILQAFVRQLRKFDVVTAPGAEPGLKAVDKAGPFAVVMSDFRMPGMNGIQFLAKVRERSPNTVRIMLTGQADLSAAAQAVNEGNIFRFLLKPCPSDVLTQALHAAVEQYRLMNTERQLLEQTLRGTVEVLSEILGMVNPEAFGRAYRMRRYVLHMTRQLQVADEWQYEIAALLSQIGCIAVPPDILDKIHVGERLTEEEHRIYASHSQVGHDLLAQIPRLDIIARMIQNQNAGFDGSEGHGAADPIALGGQMLRAALDFDELLIRGETYASAAAKLRASFQYNPALIAALETAGKEESGSEIRAARIADLQAGMVLSADVRSKNGLLLLCRGQEITPSVIAHLRSFSISPTGVIEPLTVTVRWPTSPRQCSAISKS